MTQEELKQITDTEAHFNQILPVNCKLPSKNGWKIINNTTVLNSLKPLATVMVHKNDSYIIKVMEGFKIASKMQEAQDQIANTADFDLTIAVKRGTNLFAFQKMREEAQEWYCMYCIPMNDRQMMDKIMMDIVKQGNTVAMLLIKSDLNDFNK